MTHSILEKHRTHRDQVINIFSSTFKIKAKIYQITVKGGNGLVISFIIFIIIGIQLCIK